MPNANSPYLFKFKRLHESGSNAFGALSDSSRAPDIVNLMGFDPDKPAGGTSKVSVVDVVNDFEWTHTPSHGRHEIPFLRMSEYRVNFNSLLQNIRYLLSSINKYTTDTLKTNFKNSGIGGELGAEAFDLSVSVINAGVRGIGKIPGLGRDFNPTGIKPYLNPYYGLYGATPTGFEYYFPHFDQDWKQINSKWDDWQGGGGFLSEAYSKFFSKQGFLKTIESSALLSSNVVGSFIERPKSYTYGTDTPSITVRLELSNTQRVTDVIRNWQLIFLLLYQNLPNKTSKLLLEPPVIYEVEVPGTFYTPYAYISNLKITNRGAVRLMNVPYYEEVHGEKGTGSSPVPALAAKVASALSRAMRLKSLSHPLDANGTGTNNHIYPNYHGIDIASTDSDLVTIPEAAGKQDQQLVPTIIPDAYQIEITLQSLIPESKNLFYHSVLGNSTRSTGIYASSFDDKSLLTESGDLTMYAAQKVAARGLDVDDVDADDTFSVEKHLGLPRGAAIGKRKPLPPIYDFSTDVVGTALGQNYLRGPTPPWR